MRGRELVFTIVFFAVACRSVSAESGSKMPSGELYVNSFGMKFVRIEPGSFKMGQPDKSLPWEILPEDGGPGVRMDYLRWGEFDEKPVHTVTITKPFYMGVYEVTNYQYELFDPEHKKLRGKDKGLSRKDDEAVINVSWYDAEAFCRWLSEKEGLPYRLPTEAEWEYACRAGTSTNFYTGDMLPKQYHKMQYSTRGPEYVSLRVGEAPPNPWGLYDMHGNVEEWCYDWYGPYRSGHQIDPVGYADGIFRVTRGGSHGTALFYLRSANRMGALPEDKHWMLGFRVVIGEPPYCEGPEDADKSPGKAGCRGLPAPPLPLNQRGVVQRSRAEAAKGPDPDKPYFRVRKYVRIPSSANGPVYALHNHDPAIVECPNGDLLACWYTCIAEKNRELAQAASRLVLGDNQWQMASPFWDAPDRNDHAPAMWFDGKDTIYHFTGMSAGAAYGNMVVVMRTSKDSGATWSKPRIILPEHRGGHMPVESVFRMKDGAIALTSDGSPTLWVSFDEGLTWTTRGGAIAGNHPGVVQLSDGTLLAFTRDRKVDGKMPIVFSEDLGRNWRYEASKFPPISGGQRLVLLKLRGGELFFASFASRGMEITDATGQKRKIRGLFCALSEDEGKSWPYVRLVSDDGPGRPTEGTDGALFLMSTRFGEESGYLSVCQGINSLINLISSRQHYAFNLKWIKTPPPPPKPPLKVKYAVETFDGPEHLDLGDWAAYKAFTGTFNGKGQYTINCQGRAGGINRIIGEGSFEALLVVKNMHFNPPDRKGQSFVEMSFRDGLVRKQAVYIREKDIGIGESANVTFATQPESVKIRMVWDAEKCRTRVFYGINGSEPKQELEISKKGLYMKEPFTESTACFILVHNGQADIDHFEIKPLAK